MNEWLRLSNECFDLALAPDAGGSIARFDVSLEGGVVPVFRPASTWAKMAVEMGSFPMVPFCNRVRGGAFTCDDKRITLAPNAEGDPSPLHGQGWLARWQVDRPNPATATLSFRHDAGEWPWTYSASQHIELDKRGLTITLRCRNLSREPMPCGLGIHPFFPCDGETRMSAQVREAWAVDDNILPIELLPAEGHYALQDRTIDRAGLDNGFEGWDGEALLSWPTHSVRITADECNRLQIYAPLSGGLFAAEPVQHSNCALNAPIEQWSEFGIELLAQDEERRFSARFDVIAHG